MADIDTNRVTALFAIMAAPPLMFRSLVKVADSYFDSVDLYDKPLLDNLTIGAIGGGFIASMLAADPIISDEDAVYLTVAGGIVGILYGAILHANSYASHTDFTVDNNYSSQKTANNLLLLAGDNNLPTEENF